MTTPSTPARFIDRLDSATRKLFPMCTGVVDYAPDALAAIAFVSWFGNNKHNQGEPLHHARGKSTDHSDCEMRHMSTRGDVDPSYVGTPIAEVAHLAEKAWRALLELQETMEAVYGLPLPRGARPATVAEAIDDVIRAGGTDPEDDEAEGGFTHIPRPRRPRAFEKLPGVSGDDLPIG